MAGASSQEIHLKAGSKVIIDAGAQISLKGAGGFVDIGPGGVTIQGTMVSINSGGSAGTGSGSSPKDPKAPAEADTAKSGSVGILEASSAGGRAMGGQTWISALCFIFLIQILGGCVAVTAEKTSAIGAEGGAAPGTGVGGTVGVHKVRQLKARHEVIGETAYTPLQGAVAKIRNTVAVPRAIKPGDRLTLRAEYTVLAPDQDDEVKVKEARTIFFNDQQLAELPEWELTLEQGTHEIEFPLTLPQEAADGTYRVLTTVEPVAPGNGKRGHELTPFVVAR